MASFRSASSAARSKPSEAPLVASSPAVSSKAMKTPGSPNRVAPWTRNSRAIKVLPHPGPPQTRVVRPRGRPPQVISSSPWIPVGTFSSRPGPLVLGSGSFAVGAFMIVLYTQERYPTPREANAPTLCKNEIESADGVLVREIVV